MHDPTPNIPVIFPYLTANVVFFFLLLIAILIYYERNSLRIGIVRMLSAKKLIMPSAIQIYK